ncbi:hypothetical protein PoB_003919500 [Plakobranchus ocellatus]|uniref:Uncharacterized protein n=1 Tax=Plakobranchus ocellatus TaxID=259542 RepID=A0AAV4B0S2_9GAST|nr:hypothetical protein PoB_003919500 [Plakobranchus ocellatus]
MNTNRRIATQAWRIAINFVTPEAQPYKHTKVERQELEKNNGVTVSMLSMCSQESTLRGWSGGSSGRAVGYQVKGQLKLISDFQALVRPGRSWRARARTLDRDVSADFKTGYKYFKYLEMTVSIKLRRLNQSSKLRRLNQSRAAPTSVCNLRSIMTQCTASDHGSHF